MSDALLPFSSLLFRDVVGTPQMREVWSEGRLVESWMMVERAITEAQAKLGMIPESAAREISSKLTLETLPVEAIDRHRKQTGHLMVAFLKAFREACGPAAEHFHVGTTTQDVLDMGLALQMRQAHGIIMCKLWGLEETLCERALQHKNTVMMGRSHQQPAGPTTFGLVLASWAAEIAAHVERGEESEKRWQLGSLSAAVGTQAAYVELADAETASRLETEVCGRLGLGRPLGDMHSRTDRFAEVVTNLAELASTLGEIGVNLASWQRPEVGETEEPYPPERYSSSTMPNKVNPESSEQVEGLAKVVRGLGLAMQDVQMMDNRDSTRIPVEYTTIPLSFLMTSRAVASIHATVAGLVVHQAAMRENLEHPRDLGRATAERLMIAMYRKTGERDRAHTLLHECARLSRETDTPFREVVQRDPRIGGLFTPEELSALFELSSYTGTAAERTEEVVGSLRQRRSRPPASGGSA